MEARAYPSTSGEEITMHVQIYLFVTWPKVDLEGLINGVFWEYSEKNDEAYPRMYRLRSERPDSWLARMD